jgi:hypothetical protein
LLTPVANLFQLSTDDLKAFTRSGHFWKCLPVEVIREIMMNNKLGDRVRFSADIQIADRQNADIQIADHQNVDRKLLTSKLPTIKMPTSKLLTVTMSTSKV